MLLPAGADRIREGESIADGDALAGAKCRAFAPDAAAACPALSMLPMTEDSSHDRNAEIRDPQACRGSASSGLALFDDNQPVQGSALENGYLRLSLMLEESGDGLERTCRGLDGLAW